MENISYKWHAQHDARLSVISFFYSTTPYHIVTVTHIRTRAKWGSSQWTFCPWAECPGGWERHWLYLKHSNPITKKWQNVNHCQFCIINNKNWYGWYHPLSFPIFSIFSKLKKDNHLEPEAFSVSWGLPWLDGRRPWTTLHSWKHRSRMKDVITVVSFCPLSPLWGLFLGQNMYSSQGHTQLTF